MEFISTTEALELIHNKLQYASCSSFAKWLDLLLSRILAVCAPVFRSVRNITVRG